jgi:hypothetical protein
MSMKECLENQATEKVLLVALNQKKEKTLPPTEIEVYLNKTLDTSEVPLTRFYVYD